LRLALPLPLPFSVAAAVPPAVLAASSRRPKKLRLGIGMHWMYLQGDMSLQG